MSQLAPVRAGGFFEGGVVDAANSRLTPAILQILLPSFATTCCATSTPRDRSSGTPCGSAQRLSPATASSRCFHVPHRRSRPAHPFLPPPPSFPRSYCPQWALDWEHRKHSILKEILTHMSGEWQAAGGSRAGPCPPPQVLTSFALALPQTLSPCRRSSRASTTIFLRPK